MRLVLLSPIALVACVPSSDKVLDSAGYEYGEERPDDEREDEEDAEREDEAPLSWTELRTITTSWGCTFEINGTGNEIEDSELSALCPECEHLFEVETTEDIACADTEYPIQVVSPYYRGIHAWGTTEADIYAITQQPFYELEAAYLVGTVDTTGGGRVRYSYAGDLGEYGTYTVEAVLIVD